MSAKHKKARPGAGRERASSKVHDTTTSIHPCLLCGKPGRLAISLVTEIDGALVGTGVCIACIEKRGGHFSQADHDLILGRRGGAS